MSNRDRIARAAEEAELTAKERAAAKAAKPAAPAKRTKRAAEPTRMKIVWEVVTGGGTPVATFPYPEKAAAEAKAAALRNSTERTHTVRPTKVPME